MIAVAAGVGAVTAAFAALFVVLFVSVAVAQGCVAARMAGVAAGGVFSFGGFALGSVVVLWTWLVYVGAVAFQLLRNLFV